MTLEASFQELNQKLITLESALEYGLLWAVNEGKPEEEDHALVSRYDDAATDLLGSIKEAEIAARNARAAFENQSDLAGASNALIKCQKHFTESYDRFCKELVSFESLRDVESLAKEQPARWLHWVIGLRDALEHCGQPFRDVNRALFLCWQEFSANAVSLLAPLQRSMRPEEWRVPIKNPGTKEIKIS